MQAGIRKGILLTLLAGAAVYAAIGPNGEWLWSLGGGGTPMPASRPGSGPGQAAIAEEGTGKLALRDRAQLGDAHGELFSARAWQPQASVAAAKPPAPTVPSMPYKFAGKLLQDGKLQVFVSRGDTVVPIREGETLDGTYRVDSINEDKITLIYLPLKHRESIPVFSLLADPGQQSHAAPPIVASRENPNTAAPSKSKLPAVNPGRTTQSH